MLEADSVARSGVAATGGDANGQNMLGRDDHYRAIPLPSQYEDELDRIRTEGDLALIKVQTERKKLAEVEAKLQALAAELKQKKKKKSTTKSSKTSPAPAPDGYDGRGKNLHLATRPSDSISGKGVIKQLPATPQLVGVSDGASVGRRLKVAASDRLMEKEERLKAAISERTVVQQKLRHAIDETRRERLEALASEQRILAETCEAENDVSLAREEMEKLKHQMAALKSEIVQMEQAFDVEKQTFRAERQQLLMEMEEIGKSEKAGPAGQSALSSQKQSLCYNIGHRKKYERMSSAKKMSLEQKLVSFEQKKRLLDRIVGETNVENMSEFIQKYNTQERIKTDTFARIEAQTASNAILNESIAQLAEDISRLNGAGETDASSCLEKPSELQKLLDADDVQIKRWTKDAQVFAEATKSFRGPIHDLHKEFFPKDSAEEAFTGTSELGVMRQIGAIEERIMQFIMAKILEETDSAPTPNSSETLRRLRRYQGRREQHVPTSPTQSSIEPPSALTSDGMHFLQHGKDDNDDDDDDDDIDDPTKEVAVVHSDVFRRKFSGLSTVDHSNGNATANESVELHGGATRKNATVSL